MYGLALQILIVLLIIFCSQEPGVSVGTVACAWNPKNPRMFVTSSLDMSLSVWDLNKREQPICKSFV